MDRNGSALGGISMCLLCLTIFWLGRGAFVGEGRAIQVLQAQGYSNIQIMDQAWFAVGNQGCDWDDAALFTVQATDSAGKPAEVYVCTGVFSDRSTIRTHKKSAP